MTEAEPRPRVPRSRLTVLRVAELRDLAASLGIGSTATMRKGTLVDAITERYDASQEERTEDAGSAVQDVAAGTRPEEQQQGTEPAGDDAVPEPATVTSAESAVDEAEGGVDPDAAAPGVDQPEAAASEPQPESEPGSDDAADPVQQEQDPVLVDPVEPRTSADSSADPATPAEVRVDEAEGGAEAPDDVAEEVGAGDPRPASGHVNAGLTGIAEDLQELQRGGADGEQETAEGERPTGGRRGRGRGRGRGQQQGGQGQQGGQQQAQPAAQPDVEAQPEEQAQQPDRAEPEQPAQQGGQQQDGEGRRGRYRDRKRRSGNEWDEPEIRDDDVLIPIAGILDVLENYAFVRTSGYLSGPNDVYVSLGQVKKYHLRRGDAVVGAIRQVPEGEQPTRQKYNALVKVDSINGLPVAEADGRVDFEQLTPLYPQERLRLETEPQKLTARIIDLVSPIGKGQRGLVVGPGRSGRTLLLQAVANAVTTNNPEAHLMVVLVDERPEEVTEMRRTVKGEVIASTFDRPAEDHTTVAELAIDRAKRLVELGYDVVVLVDSITRLARAYNLTVAQSGRSLGAGLDAAALLPAKRFFGAARNIENGGSLTLLATAVVESGARADEVILEELRGTANLELRLSGALADKRIFPAVDVTASGTRREEVLMGPDEVRVTWQLRRALASHDPQEALDVVLSQLRETSSNVEFLVQMQKSLPSGS